MKKRTVRYISAFLAMLLLLPTGLLGCSKQPSPDTNTAYVSIAIEGELILPCQAVPLEDKDGNGTITMADALQSAHDIYCDEKDSFALATTDNKTSIAKLWGDDSGAYGYKINNTFADRGLSEPIESGDHIYAYVYGDKKTWSDYYFYFDKNRVILTEEEDNLTLTLFYAGYNESRQKHFTGALVREEWVLLNGEKCRLTNRNGTVTIPKYYFNQGENIITAKRVTGWDMVPPICVVRVE